MLGAHQSLATDVEVSIGPHPARRGWRVLRVSFAQEPEHQSRIARALDALIAPAIREERPDTVAVPHADPPTGAQP